MKKNQSRLDQNKISKNQIGIFGASTVVLNQTILHFIKAILASILCIVALSVAEEFEFEKTLIISFFILAIWKSKEKL